MIREAVLEAKLDNDKDVMSYIATKYKVNVHQSHANQVRHQLQKNSHATSVRSIANELHAKNNAVKAFGSVMGHQLALMPLIKDGSLSRMVETVRGFKSIEEFVAIAEHLAILKAS